MLIRLLKIVGLSVGLVGLIAGALNLNGFFTDKEKLQLANLVRDSKGGIARDTPGFEKFLSAFPPPPGVTPDIVTHIVKDVIQTHDGFPVSVTVRYLARNVRTQAVASLDDVISWSEKTNYGWWTWGITALGWLVVATTVIAEFFLKRVVVSQTSAPGPTASDRIP